MSATHQPWCASFDAAGGACDCRAPQDAPPFTATAVVEADGTLRVLCDCGDLDERGHPDTGGEIRALQRLNAHLKLHTTAAARFVPWSQVQQRRTQLERAGYWREQDAELAERSRPRRDDDYGPSAGIL